jgi:hypothetical protein
MTKHRAGRPRKAGPRQPCGHLRPSGAEPPSPAQIKRIQTGLLKSSQDQHFATDPGRLYMLKLLTERQFSASIRVADIYGREDRRMGRRRSIQSPSYLIGRSGAGDLAEERMTVEERGEAATPRWRRRSATSRTISQTPAAWSRRSASTACTSGRCGLDEVRCGTYILHV